MDSETFDGLLDRVRNGDTEAAESLVREFEDAARRVARGRLRDTGLREVVDSMDVTQSVWLNFFVRATAGGMDVETPEQLAALLGTMVRNKVVDHVRHHTAAKRDARRTENQSFGSAPVADDATTPSTKAERHDLLAEFERQLPEEDRRILALRQEGRRWEEIGETLGENADALRKRFQRNTDRIAARLGLQE